MLRCQSPLKKKSVGRNRLPGEPASSGVLRPGVYPGLLKREIMQRRSEARSGG
jgi:hypothetical protein